jgi:hypothetical protein
MNTTGQFNDKRLPGHDYNEPGTYHLLLDIAENAGTLGSMRKGIMTLNRFGEIFLGILGMALQIFTCLRVDAMDIRPRCVEFVVTITKRRKPFLARFKKMRDRWHYRRTMTISVFTGYLKMNSGRRINEERKASGHFWVLGFRDRVLSDQAEIDRVCARLNARYGRLRRSSKPRAKRERAVSLTTALTAGLSAAFGALYHDAPVVSGMLEVSAQPQDVMLLGRALFLNTSLLRPLPGAGTMEGDGEGTAMGASGGGRQVPLIWSVGPGPIFLSVPPER